MTVQLHYYGSVFDLDPANPDDFWVRHIDEEIGAIEAGTRAPGFFVELADGRAASIPYHAGDRIVVVAPRGVRGY